MSRPTRPPLAERRLMSDADWERRSIMLAADVIASGEVYCARHEWACGGCCPADLSAYLHRGRALVDAARIGGKP